MLGLPAGPKWGKIEPRRTAALQASGKSYPLTPGVPGKSAPGGREQPRPPACDGLEAGKVHATSQIQKEPLSRFRAPLLPARVTPPPVKHVWPKDLTRPGAGLGLRCLRAVPSIRPIGTFADHSSPIGNFTLAIINFPPPNPFHGRNYTLSLPRHLKVPPACATFPVP
jgi:hypothetical protein